MITRRLRLQLVVFCVLAAVGVTYVAATYVGVGRLVGLSGYSVTVSLPRTGGIFENGEVTYRGVPVGRIESLRPGPDRIEAEVLITNEDLDIPRDLAVVVRTRSAIGEQYLDLRPSSYDGPYLAGGDRLSVAEGDLPMRLDRLLDDLVAFNDSVPTRDLGVVVDEMYEASRDSGDDLRALIDTSTRFIDLASSNFDSTASLIDNSEQVLRTQRDSADSIRSFSTDLRLLAEALESSDRSIRDVVRSGPDAAREVQRLFEQVGRPLSVLLGDLLTLNELLASRTGELEDVLIHAPSVVRAVAAVLGPHGLRMGLVAGFTDPLPCTTGYEQTKRRRGLETDGGALNRGAGCDTYLPRGADSAPHRGTGGE